MVACVITYLAASALVALAVRKWLAADLAETAVVFATWPVLLAFLLVGLVFLSVAVSLDAAGNWTEE